MHVLHAASPDGILYFPETHSEHISPLRPVEPALQIQSVGAKLPEGEYEFERHGVHVELWGDATDVEYVPAPHSMHVQFWSAPTDSEYVPAWHAMHVEATRAPTDAENVPATHGTQSAEPCNVLYVPGTHGMHVLPSAPVYPASH